MCLLLFLPCFCRSERKFHLAENEDAHPTKGSLSGRRHKHHAELHQHVASEDEQSRPVIPRPHGNLAKHRYNPFDRHRSNSDEDGRMTKREERSDEQNQQNEEHDGDSEQDEEDKQTQMVESQSEGQSILVMVIV